MENKEFKITFKDYLDALNKMDKRNPEIAEFTLVYSVDEEGNAYHQVNWLPTVGHFSKFGDFIPANETEEESNAVCVN